MPLRDSGEGSTGSGQQPTAPPGSGLPQPSSPTSGSPATAPPAPAPAAPSVPATMTPQPSVLAEPTPLPPVTAPSEPGETKGSSPKSDPSSSPPAVDGETKAPGEKPQPGPTINPEVVKPDLPAPPLESSEPSAKPANPATEQEAHRPAETRNEKPSGVNLSKPKVLREEDLKPKHEGLSHEAPVNTVQPEPTNQSETLGKKAEDSPTLKETPPVVPKPGESAPVVSKPGPAEPPARTPASEPDASRMPERSIRDKAVGGGPGASAPESTGSASRTMRDQAEAGWVRIPNKGRIPWEVGGDPDASGRASRRGSEPALDRRIGSELGSPVFPGEDTDARGIGGSASPRTGLGLAVPDIEPTEGPRAGAGSSRVEPSLHIVNRGENFWTISRLYYGDGRYYRALWKANSKKYPNIEEIHINDVILIPAVEDLDPAYIGSPRRRRSAGREVGSTGDQVAGSAETALNRHGSAEVGPDDADRADIRCVRRHPGPPQRPRGSRARAAGRGGRKRTGSRPSRIIEQPARRGGG